MTKHRSNVAILASGSGSTAESFIEATQDGRVDADVSLVICNNPPEKAEVYSRVERLNRIWGLEIEMVHISSLTHPKGKVGRGQTLAESSRISELAQNRGVEHIALMGYMKKIRGELIDEYGWMPHFSSPYEARMTNTHPGPLPTTRDTYGRLASEKVLELGLEKSWHTFHLVAFGIDEGPILAEHPVEILEDDSPQELFDRVQWVEKAALPYAIDKFLNEQEEYRRGDS